MVMEAVWVLVIGMLVVEILGYLTGIACLVIFLWDCRKELKGE